MFLGKRVGKLFKYKGSKKDKIKKGKLLKPTFQTTSLRLGKDT